MINHPLAYNQMERQKKKSEFSVHPSSLSLSVITHGRPHWVRWVLVPSARWVRQISSLQAEIGNGPQYAWLLIYLPIVSALKQGFQYYQHPFLLLLLLTPPSITSSSSSSLSVDGGSLMETHLLWRWWPSVWPIKTTRRHHHHQQQFHSIPPQWISIHGECLTGRKSNRPIWAPELNFLEIIFIFATATAAAAPKTPLKPESAAVQRLASICGWCWRKSN